MATKYYFYICCLKKENIRGWVYFMFVKKESVFYVYSCCLKKENKMCSLP